MSIDLCFDIISDCLEDGLKTRYDNLTSYDKTELRECLDTMRECYESVIRLKERWD